MLSNFLSFCYDFFLEAIHEHNSNLWNFLIIFFTILFWLFTQHIISSNTLFVLSSLYFSVCFLFTLNNLIYKLKYIEEYTDQLIEGLLKEPSFVLEQKNYSLELIKDVFHSYFLNYFRK